MTRKGSSIDRPRRRVLLAMYWWEDRVFEGVARFAAEHGWILDCRMRWTHAVPDLSTWRGDGIIANPGVTRPMRPLLQLIKRSGIPAVGLQGIGANNYGARVAIDHDSIGHIAAVHLLDCGFRHLVFVLFDDNPIEQRRWRGFAAAAQKAEATAVQIRWRSLRHRLTRLPRPVGFMAANDLNAVAVATECLDAGWRVPEQAAIIGVDDSRILCDLAEVPLTSVNCDFERQGYEAATELQRLMQGGTPRREMTLIKPGGVTPRRSTDTVAIPDAAALTALRCLRDQYREPLRIADVARKSGASIRRLQILFRRYLGRTMIQELTRVRVEAAKRLLVRHDAKLDAIAWETGFASRFQLVRAFRRTVGVTPATYRRRAAAANQATALR